jgi:ribonuclease E
MANKMLIDATHPEETRVVVLRGNRVEEFDFESANRKQLRGNIYLAKVTRVEPSLQAAFVDYGGNRHGFLAFSEIHPDYYQIPVADRQALIDEEERAQRAAEDEADRRSRRHRGGGRNSAARRGGAVVRGDVVEAAPAGDSEPASEEQTEDRGEAGEAPTIAQAFAETSEDESAVEAEDTEGPTTLPEDQLVSAPAPTVAGESVEIHDAEAAETAETSEEDTEEQYGATGEPTADAELAPDHGAEVAAREAANAAEDRRDHGDEAGDDEHGAENGDEEEIVESVGGSDAMEEVPDRAPRYRRQYKIQEVIKRRQVMLVQVVKEERGTKGAALTTYLSLAGRYSVLMPNTARGGGISRKITSGEDRSRLKEIAQELEVPEGMGVIVRTAGASRTKTEIKRDFEYLLRLWETVRDLTLKSTAPTLVYEEGSLVKRSIRDLYSKDIDEVMVAGPAAYEEAKDFMRMLMPSHAKNVKPYADTQPLLSRFGVENQLDAMFSPTVQLRSGGYIVINQAEALVAIDVNSGRATREHHIEDTALKTNLEASDEIARQLRLRDLAGLIVIDFIDMDEKRNNRSVERRLKECLKQDRARIQVGRISHFGLLEMSRQRIRASVLESSTEKCPYCGGSGHVRSVSSLALQVLRALEEQLMRGGTHNLIARTRPDVALYVLNQKRAHLRALEERFQITITVSADETVAAPQAFVIDRGELVHTAEAARAIAQQSEVHAPSIAAEEETEEEVTPFEAEEAEAAAEAGSEQETAEPGEGGPRRRRRRRRRGRNGGETNGHRPGAPHEAEETEEAEEGVEAVTEGAAEIAAEAEAPAEEETEEAAGEHGGEPQRDGDRRRRRRGRRGGRRNRPERGGEGVSTAEPHDELAPPDEFLAPATPEHELQDAVADLDALPAAPPRAEPAEPTGAEAASSHAPQEVSHVARETPSELPPAAEEAREEAPRRRSTVREPAPLAGAGSEAAGGEGASAPVAPAAPVPEPVITEIDSGESANRPRRSGWWSRRSAGG